MPRSVSMNSLPHAPVRLTRIVTCYRQWGLIGCWIDREELFGAGVEWMVVNDAPDDACPPGLAAVLIRRAVRVVQVAHNLGRVGARNRGAHEARAEWIEFIDGDDMALPVDLADLPGTDEADILQFPAPAVMMPVTAASGWRPPSEALRHAENWSPILPRLRPFDVRLTANLWRRDFFLHAGGFDGRFDGFEDVQLAFKADRLGARVVRRARPKQLYCQRPGRETRERVRIEGETRFLRWLRSHHPEVAPEIVTGWLAKGNLYLGLSAGLDFLSHPRHWSRYLRWRFFP